MKKLFVDSEKGSDSNNGLTSDAPFKTLKKAFITYASGSVPCNIVILNENAVFFADDLYGELSIKKSLAVTANHEAKLISGIQNVAWSVYKNVFVANITDSTVIGCLDISDSNLADDGLFEPMTKCYSLEDCQATENSYYIDGANVYVYPKSASTITNIVPLINQYKIRWNSITATQSCFLYFENLNIIGASFNSTRNSAHRKENLKFEYLAVNCTYQHNIIGDCAPHNDFDVVYEYNCRAGFSKADLFNTHNSYSTNSTIDNGVVCFINCTGREAGYYAPGKGNNNIFTAHDGENVLRLNCAGYNSDGPLFADVNGCRSVYADCSSVNTGYSGVASQGSWHFNNVSASKNGLVTLLNCNIYDNRNNPRIYSECDVEFNYTDIFNNCNIKGTVKAVNGL